MREGGNHADRQYYEPAFERTCTTDNGFFTLAEVVQNIIDFETARRPLTVWFGGVDKHHVFFEGLKEDGEAYSISWGS